MGDGDGWVYCALGHRHWGRFGAAGLLISDGPHVLLQHRAAWTHHGATWGLPGGARDSHEDVVSTALREAREEAAIDEATVEPRGWWRDDHGGWSYTTVLSASRGELHPVAANPESTEVRWWGAEQVTALPLHPGLAATWPRLQRPPAALRLVVDAANVVGARPDGWWRDRASAARRLRDALAGLIRDGIPAEQLPERVDTAGVAMLVPRVVLVVEGAARQVADDDPRDGWWDDAVCTRAAAGSGDDEVVARASAAVDGGQQTLVVSADRGLRERLPAGAIAVGPSWLWGLLDSR